MAFRYDVEVDAGSLAMVTLRLGGLEKKARILCKQAVNTSAREARRKLVKAAKGRYSVKRLSFAEAMNLQPATTADLTAVLTSSGSPLSHKRFATHVNGKYAPAKMGQLKGNLKPLQKGDIKAFATHVASGYQNVQAGRRRRATGARTVDLDRSLKTTALILQREGKERYPLRSPVGSSAPVMLWQAWDGTAGKLKDEIYKHYRETLERYISQITL